jgi:hypothetical protein
MATIVDRETAESLIQEYRTQNSSAGGPALLTSDQGFLNGYFIDRESLRTILDDPKFAGISFYFAKNPDFIGSPENVFTMLYAGAEPAPAGSATRFLNTGDVYDHTPPCPPYCGDL